MGGVARDDDAIGCIVAGIDERAVEDIGERQRY
jgi:hypothetical protein